jgi:hypothetical protein
MPMRDDRMAGRSYFVEAGFETTAERTPSSNSRSRSRFRSRSRRRGGRDLEPPQKQALDEFFEEARDNSLTFDYLWPSPLPATPASRSRCTWASQSRGGAS